MKIKHKISFVALVTMLDVMVITFVIMNNTHTSINNDISNKTAANIVKNIEAEELQPEIIENEKPIEEEPKEEIVKEEENIIAEQNINETKNEEIKEEIKEEINENIITENISETEEQEKPTDDFIESNKKFDEMTLDEKNEALNSGTLALAYSELYTSSSERLTKSKGVVYYNDHRETYYDEKVLPGPGLRIPGRHVAEDGTIRDEEGYICVAANYDFMPKGSILVTSLGPAKVYDTGCAYGTIDIYVNW